MKVGGTLHTVSADVGAAPVPAGAPAPVIEIEAKQRVHEELTDHNTSSGFTANLPLGTMMRIYSQVNEIQAIRAEANAHLLAQGMSDEAAFKALSDKSLKTQVVEALKKSGASDKDIATVVNDKGFESVVEYATAFKELRQSSAVLILNPDGTPMKGQATRDDVLKHGLGLLTKAAVTFDTFATQHPTLAQLGLTGLQMALTGPTGFLRDQVLERVGVQASVDALVEKSQKWTSEYLQKHLAMESGRADLLTAGGSFGIMIGLSTLGGGSKEKVVSAAKNVREKVERIHKNSLDYKGPTHVYKITKGNEVQKVGESAQGLDKFGKSRRAESQARKLWRETGEAHETEVIAHFGGKRSAKTFEHETIMDIRSKDPKALPLNKNNH